MAPVEYRDFEIEIGPGQGREYPVFVIRSPAGEARETCRFPFDELALEGKLKDLQIAILRSGGARRVVLTSFETNVQDFGRALFDFLMTGEIRSLYDVSQREAAQQGMGLRLKLRIQPPELSSLPWEYLFDSRIAEYVCLSSQTPIVRYIELPKVIQPLKVVPPLRILGLNASPRGLATLDAENEKHRMGVALDNLVKHGQVTITWQEHTTWRDLQRLMRAGPWHIFHFIGHGGFNHLTEEGFIALEDDAGEMFQLPASLLARLIADHTALRLAILNSCDGAQGANTDVFSSSASLLVRRGLPAVLAMQYEITDRAAIEFARGFYEALADGLPVDAATSEARISVSLGVTNTIEWGTPALYMRTPDGVLFRPETSAEKANRLSIRRQQRQLAKKQATELRTHLAEKTEVINQVARQQSNPEIVEKSARERTEFQTQEKATSTQPEFETEKKTDIERTKLQSQEKITNKHVEHEASEKAAHESTELLTIPRDIPEKTTQDVHDELPVPTPIERQQHNKVYQDKTIRETKGKTNDDQHELDGQYFMSTAAKQTMASWSKVIESYDTVPEVYKGFFKTLFRDNREFPYVVFAPALGGSVHTTGEKLICDINDTIYILENVGNKVVAKGYPLNTIRDFEMGRILLSSWITINGVTTDGISTSSTVGFNTVTIELYEPFFSKIRPSLNNPDSIELKIQQAKFDYLSKVNFKFMNYARESLIGGENIITIILQPEIEIYEEDKTLLGSTIHSAHLTILTDVELIFIHEDEVKTKINKFEYGGIWHYIPLRSIVSVSLEGQVKNLITLSFHLFPNGHLKKVFESSKKYELEQLRNKIQELIEH